MPARLGTRLTTEAGSGIVERPGRVSGTPMTALSHVHRPTGLSLRARLLVMVALSTAVVVGGTTLVQRQIIVGAVEEEAPPS